MFFILKRTKHKPGQVVQRFGDWRKGEPCVIIDNERWVSYGKPGKVKVYVTNDDTSSIT